MCVRFKGSRGEAPNSGLRGKGEKGCKGRGSPQGRVPGNGIALWARPLGLGPRQYPEKCQLLQ